MDSTPAIPSPQLFDLSDRNVLITGATRGNVLIAQIVTLRAACAIALAQAGASICLVQRESPLGDVPNTTTADAIRALGGNAQIIHCDLADLDAVRELFPKALEVMGGNIHILVNCAGVQRRSPSLTFSERDWDDVLNVNLKSAWLLSQAAGRHMVPLRRGKIINFCSLMSFQGGLTVPAYASAKGALGQLTKALSNEWSQHNVQVNGICPGYITTAMLSELGFSVSTNWSILIFRTRGNSITFLLNGFLPRNERLLADETRLRQISERIPAGRWGDPKDFAGPVVFLASSASQYVCGELLLVDGGWMGR